LYQKIWQLCHATEVQNGENETLSDFFCFPPEIARESAKHVGRQDAKKVLLLPIFPPYNANF
jgi:hypothetical protein